MIRQTCLLGITAAVLPMMASLAIAEPAIQQLEFVPANAVAGDKFGSSVSFDGALGIVGAPGVGKFAGAAYLFDLATGVEIMELLPEEPDEIILFFGNSVSISGSLALVGAPGDDSNGENNGCVYVFDVSTGELIRKLINPNPPIGGTVIGESFGSSVAICGNRAIIGAAGGFLFPLSVNQEVVNDKNEENRIASAYIFDVESGELLHAYNSLDVANDFFGIAVAISDSHAIIGSIAENVGMGSGAGYAVVIDLQTGEVTHTLRSGTDATLYGVSVAISGSFGIVGQIPVSGGEAGRAYIYDLETGEELLTLVADPPLASGRFGGSVALTESYALVGAYTEDAIENDSGAAYVFSTTTGEQLSKLVADDGTFSSEFGFAVSASEEMAILSAPNHRVEQPNGGGSTIRSGQVYIFTPTCPGDCDSDAAVAFGDLIEMLTHFGGPATQGCDTDGNETIDFNDLVFALFRFGECE